MTPERRVVARFVQAGKPGSLDKMVVDWLEATGREIAKLTNGTPRVVFKRGHLLVVSVPNPDMTEMIGIRFNGYTVQVTLHHELGGEVSLIDTWDWAKFSKFTPAGLANWAVSETQGRQQLELSRGWGRKKRR